MSLHLLSSFPLKPEAICCGVNLDAHHHPWPQIRGPIEVLRPYAVQLRPPTIRGCGPMTADKAFAADPGRTGLKAARVHVGMGVGMIRKASESIKKRNCLFCGRVFVVTRRDKRCCSGRCSNRNWLSIHAKKPKSRFLSKKWRLKELVTRDLLIDLVYRQSNREMAKELNCSEEYVRVCLQKFGLRRLSGSLKKERRERSKSDEFWKNVDRFGPFSKIPGLGRCWLWTGFKFHNGYGKFFSQYAHRVSYRLNVGDVPKYNRVQHRCENPGCVNPQHLFITRARSPSRKTKGLRGKEGRIWKR